MTSPEMIRAHTSFGRPIRRLLLTVMLGLALASRLALGATVPTSPLESSAATDALGRLQAVMVMCAPDQGKTSPPAQPHKASPDDLLLFEQADNQLALPGSPTSLPPAMSIWTVVALHAEASAAPPRLCRAAWQARGPPGFL